MSSQTILTLAPGKLRLQLTHSIGGAISGFEWIDGDSSRPILRECHSPLEKVLGSPPECRSLLM
ncbi:MAG: hypothetical protein ACTHJK_10985 [Sphingomicrobium sp.]